MSALADALATSVGRDVVIEADLHRYLSDETESRSLVGRCDVVVAPRTADEVAEIVAWGYANGVPLIPRGGGTGYAGGAVPLEGGIVLSLERMTRVRSFDPLLWRGEIEAAVTTHGVQELARSAGLYYPPDPGAGEQSQLGGNIATNAGGPHAFKYGTTGAWVTGLEVIVPPGEVVRIGGPIRKDVASYDLKNLLIGSEGTLGVITAAWLRFVPAPTFQRPVFALFPDVDATAEAVEAIIGSGLLVAALEFCDAGALRAAPPRELGVVAADDALAILCDIDGDEDSGPRLWTELKELLEELSPQVVAPTTREAVRAIWRWREGMTGAVTAQRGGKVSEDIVVPIDRLAEAIVRTVEIGNSHGVPACSWGHAGDGNLHSTFMIDRASPEELEAGERAAEDLFALAIELGGSISGEHGLGSTKCGHLERQRPGRGYELHGQIKNVFDPLGLLNPGKKW